METELKNLVLKWRYVFGFIVNRICSAIPFKHGYIFSDLATKVSASPLYLAKYITPPIAIIIIVIISGVNGNFGDHQHNYVRFEILKIIVFYDEMTCGYCKNQRFEGTLRFHHQSERISELGTTLIVTRNSYLHKPLQ
jgi:hypothetical protein